MWQFIAGFPRGSPYIFRGILMALTLGAVATAQPVLHLKTRNIRPDRSAFLDVVNSPVRNGRGHLVLQYEQPPDAATSAALAARGVMVLSDIPENGLLVSLAGRADVTGLQVRYAEAIAPADKISPLVGTSIDTTGFYLVEIQPDATLADARSIVLNLHLSLR